jgi:hypothetical protein
MRRHRSQTKQAEAREARRAVTPRSEPLATSEPSPEDRAEAADRFEAEIDPRVGVDYSWVADYALQAYEQTDQQVRELDSKAEKLVAFTGTAAGIVTAIATKAVGTTSVWVGAVALPSLVFAMLSVSAGLAVLRPMRQSDLPEISTAFGYADFFAERGEAAFTAKIHQAREHRRLALARKARLLKRAHGLLLAALWWLLPPLLVAMVLRH